MACDIRINEHGQGIVEIADADGEMRSYRAELMPRGLSLWSIHLTRVDSGNQYLTRVFKDGSRGERWECSCKAFEFKKRGVHDCKHTLAMRGFRAFLARLVGAYEPGSSQITEIHHERTAQAV